MSTYETWLVINDENMNPLVYTRLSSRFSGARITDPTDTNTNLIVSEDVPVPENVWQLTPVDHRNVCLVLMDKRDSFNNTPYPVIKVVDYTGSVVHTYSDLVPSTLRNDVWVGDVLDEGDPQIVRAWNGDCKWEFWGKPYNEEHRPGPKMKVIWPGVNTNNTQINKLVVDGETDPVDGDVLVLVSCECWEKKLGYYPTGNSWYEESFTFKTRVEYKVLRLKTDFSLELIRSEYVEDIINKPSNSNQVDAISFDTPAFDEIPRPQSLVNLSMSSNKMHIYGLAHSPSKVKIYEITADTNIQGVDTGV